MSMVSRWALVVRGRLAAGDVDPGGRVLEPTVERLVREACDAYLGLVESLDELPTVTPGQLRSLQVGGARTVLVAASAAELFSDGFTVSVRLRPLGDGEAGDFRARARFERPLPAAVRDEVIAIEKAATHTA